MTTPPWYPSLIHRTITLTLHLHPTLPTYPYLFLSFTCTTTRPFCHLSRYALFLSISSNEAGHLEAGLSLAWGQFVWDFKWFRMMRLSYMPVQRQHVQTFLRCKVIGLKHSLFEQFSLYSVQFELIVLVKKSIEIARLDSGKLWQLSITKLMLFQATEGCLLSKIVCANVFIFKYRECRNRWNSLCIILLQKLSLL